MIKFDKARKISSTGKYYHTFVAIWDKLDDNLKSRLTSYELSLVIDCMFSQHQAGFAKGLRNN